MILELCDYFYDEKDMSFFLEDENMPVNELIYERMTSRLDARIAKSFDEYFSYAYAVCAKLNTDKYPEAHFKSEYWDELPSGNVYHQLIILAIAYVIIAFQKTPRLQYPKMMRAIFDWELEGKMAPQSHNVLRIFLPVMERCLKEHKHNYFTDIPGESLVNKIDNGLIPECEDKLETDFTVGRPKTKKDAENMMKQMRETLLENMLDLDEEEEERSPKNAPISGDSVPISQEFKITAKGKFAQVLHILCKMGVITDMKDQPASPQKVAEKIGPFFGEEFKRIDSSVTEAYEQDNRYEIFNDMLNHAEIHQKKREERKKN